MITSQMIEFINTNKNQKTKLDKTYEEDIIKIRHGFCIATESHSPRNEIEARFSPLSIFSRKPVRRQSIITVFLWAFFLSSCEENKMATCYRCVYI